MKKNVKKWGDIEVCFVAGISIHLHLFLLRRIITTVLQLQIWHVFSKVHALFSYSLFFIFHMANLLLFCILRYHYLSNKFMFVTVTIPLLIYFSQIFILNKKSWANFFLCRLPHPSSFSGIVSRASTDFLVKSLKFFILLCLFFISFSYLFIWERISIHFLFWLII